MTRQSKRKVWRRILGISWDPGLCLNWPEKLTCVLPELSKNLFYIQPCPWYLPFSIEINSLLNVSSQVQFVSFFIIKLNQNFHKRFRFCKIYNKNFFDIFARDRFIHFLFSICPGFLHILFFWGMIFIKTKIRNRSF